MGGCQYNGLDAPREFAIDHLGWIRVEGNNIEMKNLNEKYINQLINGLYEIFDDETETMKFNIELYDNRKFVSNIPFNLIASHSFIKMFENKGMVIPGAIMAE